jgi:hypothetical protein
MAWISRAFPVLAAVMTFAACSGGSGSARATDCSGTPAACVDAARSGLHVDHVLVPTDSTVKFKGGSFEPANGSQAALLNLDYEDTQSGRGYSVVVSRRALQCSTPPSTLGASGLTGCVTVVKCLGRLQFQDGSALYTLITQPVPCVPDAATVGVPKLSAIAASMR